MFEESRVINSPFFLPLPSHLSRSPASACDRIRASISLGIAGLSHVHYDAAVAATAATATAACNRGAENRENRRVKMKRGSSQGKWGNVSSRRISIHGISAHASAHSQRKAVAACTKTAGYGRKLSPFPTFHPVYCFSPPLLLPRARGRISVPLLSPNTLPDLKRLRCRKTTCMQPSRGVN